MIKPVAQAILPVYQSCLEQSRFQRPLESEREELKLGNGEARLKRAGNKNTILAYRP